MESHGTIRVVLSIKHRNGFNPRELDAPIPIGYMPFSLDLAAPEIVVGGPFPAKGWTNAAGATVSLNLEKSTLVAIVGEDCEVSKRALPWLNNLRSKVPVVLISDATGRSSYPGALTNPGGGLLSKVAYQATPYLALVGSSGKVKALWMGFDPERANEVERSIISKASAAE
jgi:hypothetical protein